MLIIDRTIEFEDCKLKKYKALRCGKLPIEAPPHHSSQECAACGHTHPDNRLSQAEFRCLSCENEDHADHNALVTGEVKAAKSKKTLRMADKKSLEKVGQELSEPGAPSSRTRVESEVRHAAGGPGFVHCSVKREEAPSMALL